MCTVTWWRTTGGYEIFFNRDERKTRKPARPPSIQQCHDVRYVAPADGDAGGSWIGANERGLSLCLLNNYPAYADDSASGHQSRGLLLISLMDSTSVPDVAERLLHATMADYRPFFLVALDVSSPATIHGWDGRTVISYTVADDQIPVTTSSFDPAHVIAQRKKRFADMRRNHGCVDAELLQFYHESREARGDAYSVFMRRDDAETVSISRVMVSPDSVVFDYTPRAAIERSVPREAPLVLART